MDKEAFVRGRGFGKTELGLEAMKAEIRREDMKFPKTETGCRLWANVCYLYGAVDGRCTNTADRVERIADLIADLEERADVHKQAYDAMLAELKKRPSVCGP